MSENITFEIKESVGIIGKKNDKSGWAKELNKVSWCNGQPKWDIREWSPDHRKMSRGITLTQEELQQIVDLFRDYKYRR